MAKSNLIILPFIILILLILIPLIGIFYFKWIDLSSINQYVFFNQKKQKSDNLNRSNRNDNRDLSSDQLRNLKINEDQSKSDNRNFSNSDVKTVIDKNQVINKESGVKDSENLKLQKTNSVKIGVKDQEEDDGKDLLDDKINYHALGEYVSDDEYRFRRQLIADLKLKTIVINSFTKGNGITQEYYKIVYQNKMIPAKILDDLVESQEFRLLIPTQYRSQEFITRGFKKGEEVVFKNQQIRDLLVLWSKGRLTPIQKAWETRAMN